MEQETTSSTTPSHITLLSDAKNQVKAAHDSGAVRKAVVDAIANKRIEENVKLLIQGREKIEQQQRDFDKIKPDDTKYDETGKVVSELWSKEQLEKRNKARPPLEKTIKAFEKAMVQADYSDLKNLIGGGDKPTE